MFDPFSQQGAGELNVLKRHLQSTVLTLLDRNTSQREIHRLTGVDRKTIRRYQALRAGAEANSPGEVTTGSVSADGQIPPPRPPAFGTSEATVTSSLARPVGRSKSPGYGHLKLPHLMIAVSAAEQQ
ncbi:hypothetical protein ACVL92_006690 [Bradyrhizobium liaoningense]